MNCRYTTKEVADALGIKKRTLLAWMRRGLLREPSFAPQGGVPKFRWWNESDIARAARLRDKMREKRRRNERQEKQEVEEVRG